MLNVFLSKFKCDCGIPQGHTTELTSRHDEKPDWDKEISVAKGHLRASSFLSEVWLGWLHTTTGEKTLSWLHENLLYDSRIVTSYEQAGREVAEILLVVN